MGPRKWPHFFTPTHSAAKLQSLNPIWDVLHWHTYTNTHTHTHTHHDDKTSRNRMITWKRFVKFIKFDQHAFNFYIVVYFQFHNLKLKLGWKWITHNLPFSKYDRELNKQFPFPVTLMAWRGGRSSVKREVMSSGIRKVPSWSSMFQNRNETWNRYL